MWRTAPVLDDSILNTVGQILKNISLRLGERASTSRVGKEAIMVHGAREIG